MIFNIIQEFKTMTLEQRLKKIQHDDDEGLLDYDNNRQVQEVTLLKNIRC